MGLWDSLKSVCSAAVSVVTSVVKNIGSVIADNATKLLKVGLELAGKLNPIIDAITVIAKLLGVFSPEEDTEEMGARAMKSEKSIDDFDSVDEYMHHLRNDIQLSKEELENTSEEKKWARKAIGASIALKGISEKKEMDISVEFITKAVTKGLSGDEIYDMLDDFKNNKLKPQDFVDYINNRTSTVKEEIMDNVLEKTVKKSRQDLSASEIEKEVLKFTEK